MARVLMIYTADNDKEIWRDILISVFAKRRKRAGEGDRRAKEKEEGRDEENKIKEKSHVAI